VKSGPDYNMNPFSPWAHEYAIQRIWQLIMMRTSISLGLPLLYESVRMPLPGQHRSIMPNSYYKYVPSTNSIVMSVRGMLLLSHIVIHGEEHAHILLSAS
jgi:hypothetical protein